MSAAFQEAKTLEELADAFAAGWPNSEAPVLAGDVLALLRAATRILDERLQPTLEAVTHLQGVAQGLRSALDAFDEQLDAETAKREAGDAEGDTLREQLLTRVSNCEDDVDRVKRDVDALERGRIRALVVLLAVALLACGGAAFGVGEQLEARVDAGDDVAELEAAADVADAQVQQGTDAPAADVVLLEASAVDAGLEASLHEAGPSGCAGSPGPGKWWASSLPSGSCVAVGAPRRLRRTGAPDPRRVELRRMARRRRRRGELRPNPLEPSALQVDCEGP